MRRIADPKAFYYYPDDILLARIFYESMHPVFFFLFYPQKLSCNRLYILSEKSEINEKKKKRIDDFIK